MLNEEKIKFAQKLLSKREIHLCDASLRNKTTLFINRIISFLFPHFSFDSYNSIDGVFTELGKIENDLKSILMLIYLEDENKASKISQKFIKEIPVVHDLLWSDAEEIFKGDPAAESIDEVILAYPGFMAIIVYRIAHILYKLNIPIIPRIISEYAHQLTGIDIHPGADIDSPFFIDHGTGIVIGETTKIGKRVKLYQGVTLGALSVDKSLTNVKRHPTILDDVIIYAQAVILGGETVIGSKSIIGGNTWVTASIPENSIVLSKTEIKVRSVDTYLNSIDFII
ncbi:MAG: serine O-acetyltransferase EpsC [Ignavibacteriaceae bacterium]